MQNKEFIDQFKNKHLLQIGYRDKIKPQWQKMFQPNKEQFPTKEAMRQRLQEMTSRVRLGVKMVEIAGAQVADKKILNIGCGDGTETLYLSHWKPLEIIGTNHQPLSHECVEADNATIDQQSRDVLFQQIQDQHETGEWSQVNRKNVAFLDDDICKSTFLDQSFDLIFSWRTLEHLANPRQAFSEMYRVLRPGGYAYHEYNPFFSVEGGHSLCTLDISWGHVRLSDNDIERYLAQFRPSEKDGAIDYYQHKLNRMSLHEAETEFRKAGFEISALVPRARTEDIMEMSEIIYNQARRIYPQITLNDLICRMVRVVLRRPA